MCVARPRDMEDVDWSEREESWLFSIGHPVSLVILATENPVGKLTAAVFERNSRLLFLAYHAITPSTLQVVGDVKQRLAFWTFEDAVTLIKIEYIRLPYVSI